MVDARGTAYGVVYRDVPNNGAIVMIGRPDQLRAGLLALPVQMEVAYEDRGYGYGDL